MEENNEWKYIEKKINKEEYLKNESLMTISNGYLSIRGSHEESNMSYGHDGTYLNGLYEYHALQYGEKFTSYPDKSQVMVNLPDPKVIELEVDGEMLSLEKSLVSEYARELDLLNGHLKREFTWDTQSGAQVSVISTRFASAIHKHLICIKYEVNFNYGEGFYRLRSKFSMDRQNISKKDDPRIGVDFKERPISIQTEEIKNGVVHIQGKTSGSKLTFNGYIINHFDMDHQRIKSCEGEIQGRFNEGKSIVLYKYIWLDKDETESSFEQIQKIALQGYQTMYEEHQQWWNNQWEQVDVIIKGDSLMQKAIRLNMYHLIQNVGKDGLTNISAKGMTGEGYEGHYFWDTEIYMLPFFVFTNPQIAKALLLYRYNTLSQARQRSREMGHKKGALYPWRTINGEECSSFFPAGTAQYHINADIAYGIKLYYQATDDWTFMVEYGLEMLIELANLWLDMGNVDHQGRFCIQEVTGPDEYSCLVNNNTYTNIMVKDEFIFLLEMIQKFQKNHSHVQTKLIDLILDFDQAKAKKAIENMYIAYDQTLKIYAQDDGFLSKPIWDFANTPKENYPLLMNYHPLTLYRHQVCKQADVILAELLQPKMFSLEQKKRDFDYYEKITTHDSSLSNCIYGILAAELGDLDKSYQYYMKTAKTDLEDIHHNAKDGIHAANMAGSWLGLVYGFSGFRLIDGEPTFNPQLPKEWDEYSFSLIIKDSKWRVKVNQQGFEIVEESVST